MNLGMGKDRLVAATKELRIQWEHTREYWKDAKSDAFEKKYMMELLAAVDVSVRVIHELDDLVAQIRSECE